MPAADPISFSATLHCPLCGHAEQEAMPSDACLWFYDCKACGQQLKPKPGDCCVFCSYADRPCPPVQRDGRCGQDGGRA